MFSPLLHSKTFCRAFPPPKSPSTSTWKSQTCQAAPRLQCLGLPQHIPRETKWSHIFHSQVLPHALVLHLPHCTLPVGFKVCRLIELYLRTSVRLSYQAVIGVIGSKGTPGTSCDTCIPELRHQVCQGGGLNLQVPWLSLLPEAPERPVKGSLE